MLSFRKRKPANGISLENSKHESITAHSPTRLSLGTIGHGRVYEGVNGEGPETGAGVQTTTDGNARPIPTTDETTGEDDAQSQNDNCGADHHGETDSTGTR